MGGFLYGEKERKHIKGREWRRKGWGRTHLVQTRVQGDPPLARTLSFCRLLRSLVCCCCSLFLLAPPPPLTAGSYPTRYAANIGERCETKRVGPLPPTCVPVIPCVAPFPFFLSHDFTTFFFFYRFFWPVPLSACATRGVAARHTKCIGQNKSSKSPGVTS